MNPIEAQKCFCSFEPDVAGQVGSKTPSIEGGFGTQTLLVRRSRQTEF